MAEIGTMGKDTENFITAAQGEVLLTNNLRKYEYGMEVLAKRKVCGIWDETMAYIGVEYLKLG